MKITSPLISIIMPTYNSGDTIELSLKAVVKQDYPKEKIEILVIDGGSTDNTLDIARKFGARVLKNPKIQPEYAKSIGLRSARGKYAMFLDSDEVLMNSHSISAKVDLLSKNSNCKNIITTGLIPPREYPFLAKYINRIGDPFSYFIYGVDGSDFYGSLHSRYTTDKDEESFEIIKFKRGELTTIIDGGGHFFDLDFLKSIEDIRHKDLSARVFSTMAATTRCLGVLKDDFVLHYSKPSLSGYLRKIKWRIISNLSTGDGNIPGYKNRESLMRSGIKIKKYLFIPYAFSLIFPFFDAAGMVIKYGDLRYLAHVPLTLYTAIEISIQLIKIKLFGQTRSAGVYG